MPPVLPKPVMRFMSRWPLLVVLALWLCVSAIGESDRPRSHRHRPATPDSNHRHALEQAREIGASTALSNFDEWCDAFVQGRISGRRQIKKGVSLARDRFEVFKELLALDAKTALERTIPTEVYRRLPASIQQHTERRISAYGDFMVLVAMMHDHHSGQMTGSRVSREVVIDGVHYPAIVYGRRETMPTKLNIPLQGIIVGDSIILDEAPLRQLSESEIRSLPPDSIRTHGTGVVAEVGGKLMSFSSPAALQAFAREQIEWESKIGPVRPKAGEPLSPWTVGAKTVLFIRVDFSDAPGEPVSAFNNEVLTEARAQALIDNEVNSFYVNNSYNQTSLQATVTPVIRLPQTQSYYISASYTALFTDGEAAARAAGYDVNNFNLYLIGMTGSHAFSYGGLGYVGYRGAILNGAFVMYPTAHELGHNYGLWHANTWMTTDGSVIGPGFNFEYGNAFDVMGQGGNPESHFGANYKRRLDWLTDANVQMVTTDGIYRLLAHDSTIPGGIRALKIRKGSTRNYWIEFRQLFPNCSAFNGALLTWDYESANYNENELLDMDPSTTDPTDGALKIGQTLDDTEDHIRLTVLGKGNTTPQSLDVKVELNVGCSFALNQTSQSFASSGGEGTFSVSTASGCIASATANDSWLTVSSTGATVRYFVAANDNSQSRTGTINVNGQAFSVHQDGSQTACVPRPPGMVAWWRGEGNALDQTGVNNGVLVNGMQFAPGQVGTGFLGSTGLNQYPVEVPDSPSLTLTSSMSIEGWLKINSSGNPVSGSTVLIRQLPGDQFSGSYAVRIMGSSELQFAINGTTFFTGRLPLGQFVHFAATFDDASNWGNLYINGRWVKSRNIFSTPDPAPGSVIKIGQIDGIIDEVAIYNRALSPEEIEAIYSVGAAGTGAIGKCLSQPGPNTIQLSSAATTVNESSNTANLTVTRTGDTSAPATVKYTTSDTTDVNFNCNPATNGQITGVASRKCDYHIASGRLRFAAGETSKQLPISIVNDIYVEPSESFTISLTSPTGAIVGTQGSETITITDDDVAGQANPIDMTPFYVRMLYVDLLSREPDPAGYAGWIHRIDFCGQAGEPPPPCDRVTVGGDGFLRSTEFFDREFFVIGLYRTALGRIPQYDDVADLAYVSGFLSTSDLELNKTELVADVMKRFEFGGIYNSLNNSQFVDTLIQKSGVVFPNADRDAWVNDLNAGAKSRARVFRELSERPEVSAKYLHEAQVVSCYYGFFTRNPDGAYLDFLQRLDSGQINLGDLANAFINSAEYRRRFGP